MKTRTKKDIIKNIAIVFLVIMLVLTFFSNTILNWSLPQVSGKYTEYGQIKTGVRGSGTVISNMTYTESVKGLRTVEAVYINRGSEVEAGQLLMLLSATESDEIEALKAEISSLQEAYDRALLGREENDYTSDELAIRNAEEDLNEIKTERAFYTDEYVAEVKAAAERTKAELDKASELVEQLEEELDELSENSSEPEIVSARQAVEEANEQYELATAAYDKAVEALEGASYTDTDSLSNTRSSLIDTLSALEKELDYLREDNAALIAMNTDVKTKKTAYDKTVTAYNSALEKYNEAYPEADNTDSSEYLALQEAEAAMNAAKAEYDSALSLYEENEDDIKTATRTIDAKLTEISNVESEISYIRNQITNANASNREYINLKNTADIKKGAMESAKDSLDAKQKALDDAVKKLNKATAEALKTAKKAQEEAAEAETNAAKEFEGLSKIEALDAEIKSGERSLESMKLALERRKENDSKADKLEDYDLNKQYREIQDKKAELSALEGNSKEGYELRATHSGVVTEVNYKAGEIAADGSSAVVIEVQESGYSLSFSVSNAEAMKVKAGDTATVSDTYWGQNVGAVLKSIVPDAGGKTKTLNFELSGNVNVGQTLTLLVGERTTDYSSVVPKSALREDSKGKFIYITKTKSTPLGNRYVATRLDVTVAAEDDKNVAIVTDETYLYEYVIVSSTKPFEEGGYVRLSD